MSVMRNIPNEVRSVESRIAAAGYSIDDMLYHSKISRPTFYGWKRGSQSPTLENWDKLIDTVDKMEKGKIAKPATA
jgi:predicted transcriptional regulator